MILKARYKQNVSSYEADGCARNSESDSVQTQRSDTIHGNLRNVITRIENVMRCHIQHSHIHSRLNAMPLRHVLLPKGSHNAV